MGQNMSANTMKLFVSFSINYSTLSFEEAIERSAAAARTDFFDKKLAGGASAACRC
jgi:hypothetical protein